ncbi:MAG: hypothetical protein AAFY76_25330 [Cyanobacteria bacterium J06649_11]
MAQPLTIKWQVTLQQQKVIPMAIGTKTTTVMKNFKVKTQKTTSAILAIALAAITLFQAGAANSYEATYVSAEEEALLTEFDQYFAEEAMDMELEEMFIEEFETTESVKVYNQNNELIGEGNPDTNPLLGKLVNQADYLSEMGGEKYYQITE